MQNVVVTGGANGIGFHISTAFYKARYNVIALDIKPNANLIKEIDFIQMDLSSIDDIKNSFEYIEKKYSKLHILINNGAISQFQKPIVDVLDNELSHILDVNLKACFLCAKYFISLNSGENFGRIINISSTRSHQNEANWDVYGMSKGGLISLTNSLCISLSNTPITVNAISPGYIEVNNYKNLDPNEHKIHPSRRVGKPKDIVNACLFLSNKENDFINGNNLIIDGGMTKKMVY